VFCGKGGRQTARMVLSYAGPKMGTKNNADLRLQKGYKGYVLGYFWDTRRISLYLMDRDFESKKHGYSANSYIKVLDAIVAPAIEELNDPGYIFMRDNAFIHTTYSVRDWFTNAALICLD
jgi:hypothetical protein